MTLDEILNKFFFAADYELGEGYPFDSLHEGMVSVAEAKQAIKEAIERAEPDFRELHDDDTEKYYNAGYNHALSDYRVQLLRELGLIDNQTSKGVE